MKRYQAVAFLLSTAMTVSSVAPVFGASNDVFGHWAEFTITKWQNEGRIGGYEDGTFRPDQSITRAEFVRLLNSAVPTAFTSSANVSFSDVKESDWFFADVAQAVGSGVTSGFEDGTFRPGETVTRMQAAVFIAKAKGLAANEAAANNFTDAASIPAWAKGAVGAAVSAGYLSGYPDGSFGGSKGMTRAEAVSTLDRVLGGTSTSSQTPSQGEVDTTDRDSQQKEETTTTANAGDMVWTSGGSGGGSRRGSSSSSSSSSSSNTISKNVTIRNQDDADDYKGKTLTGKATIYAKDGLELNDIRFKGDVDIIADSTATAAAYTDGDTAVAAAYLTNINIYFEGRTNVSGKITVIRDGVPASTQVIIRTRTPRAISAIVKALMPTRIVGFEVAQVEAKAPVEIASDAKVGTITADDGASVEAQGEVGTVNVTGDVDNIVLDGTGNTSVKVSDKASVDKIEVKDNTAANIRVNGDAKVGTVAVSDKANAKVDVNDTAKVDKVDVADSAVVKLDVAPEATVDTFISTSKEPGSEITGDGTVNDAQATDPSTVDTSNAGDNVANVDKTEESGSGSGTGTTTPEPEATQKDVKATVSAKVDDDIITLTITEGEFDATNGAKAENYTLENLGTIKSVALSDDNKEVKITLSAALEEAVDGTVTIKAAAFKQGTDATIVKTVSAKASNSKDTPVTGELAITQTGLDTGNTMKQDATNVTLTVKDGDADVTADVQWSYEPTDIVTVDKTGKVTASKEGTVKITATANGKTGTITIKVEPATPDPIPVTAIELSANATTINVGKTANLTVAYTPSDATNQKVTWASGNEEVATVSEEGVVTGKTIGKATITATAADKATDGTAITDEIEINVVEADAPTIAKGTVTGDVTFGTAGEFTCNFTTTNIVDTKTLTVTEVNEDGTNKATDTDGLTVDTTSLAVTNNAAAVKISATNAVPAGNYYFKASYTDADDSTKTAESTVVKVTVAKKKIAATIAAESGFTLTEDGSAKAAEKVAIAVTGVKDDVALADLTVTPALPTGLELAAAKDGTNGIKLTLSGKGTLAKATTYSVVVKASAMGDATVANNYEASEAATFTITPSTVQGPAVLQVKSKEATLDSATKTATYTLADNFTVDTNASYKVYAAKTGGEALADDVVTAGVSGKTLTLTFTTAPTAQTTYYIETVKTTGSGADQKTETSATRLAVVVKPATGGLTNTLNVTVAEGKDVGDIKITTTDATAGASYKYAFSTEEVTGLQTGAEVPAGATALTDKTAGANVSLSSATAQVGDWVTLYAYTTDTTNNKDVVSNYKSVQITNDKVNAPADATADDAIKLTKSGTTATVAAYTAPDAGLGVSVYLLKSTDYTDGEAIPAEKLTNANKITQTGAMSGVTLEDGASYQLVTVHDASGAYVAVNANLADAMAGITPSVKTVTSSDGDKLTIELTNKSTDEGAIDVTTLSIDTSKGVTIGETELTTASLSSGTLTIDVAELMTVDSLGAITINLKTSDTTPKTGTVTLAAGWDSTTGIDDLKADYDAIKGTATTAATANVAGTASGSTPVDASISTTFQSTLGGLSTEVEPSGSYTPGADTGNLATFKLKLSDDGALVIASTLQSGQGTASKTIENVTYSLTGLTLSTAADGYTYEFVAADNATLTVNIKVEEAQA